MSEKPKLVSASNAAPINALRPLTSGVGIPQPIKLVAPAGATKLGQPVNQIRPVPTSKKGK